ncbi:MAG: ABC transporter substrate-binding protein, partial [Cyanobacteria bacterium J06639_1]
LRRVCPAIGLLLLLASCQPQPEAAIAPERSRSCLESYDAAVDYFPHKIQTQHAAGFEVEYHNHYKVVTVRNPWRGATETFRYVLVQCGAPTPEDVAGAQVVEVPVRSAIALSTTHLPHFAKLDLLDRLVGVSRFRQVNTPAVREKIDRGELVETGSGSTLNVEGVLATRPDLVLTFGTGNAETDSHPKLLELGIPVAIVSEYMESSPLGRAEWLKFTALFFNAEKAATEVFAEIDRQYEATRQLVQNVDRRPTVFTGFSYNGTWFVPGGQSYVAQFLDDAGADYLWADRDTIGSIPLDFEAVFDRAVEAEYWLNGSQEWRTRADAIARDDRYGRFQALQESRLFNNDARLNPSGGNDYWESGMVNPHVVLADLIAMFHPELLPDRELVYYRRLD